MGGLSSPLCRTKRAGGSASPSWATVRFTGGNAREAQNVTARAPLGTRPVSSAVRPKTVAPGASATAAGSETRSGKPTSNGAGVPSKRTRTRRESSSRRRSRRMSRSAGLRLRIAATTSRASALGSVPRASASRSHLRSARNVPSPRMARRVSVKDKSWAQAGTAGRASPASNKTRNHACRSVSLPKPPSSVKILSSKVPGAMPADSRSDALLVQLAELHRARKTGRLVVARGAQILFIYLRQGQIAGVESESAPEAGGTDPDEPVFLDPLDLGGDPGLARAAARERLLEALAWPEGSCAFTEGGTAEGGDPPLQLATEEVLAEAAQGVKDPALIRAALGDLDRILGLAFDPSKPKNLTLTPTEGYILSRVDGTLAAREVLQLVPLESSETERGLFTLLIGGLIEYLPLPGRPAARPGEAATPVEPPNPKTPTPPPGQLSLTTLSPEQREAQRREIEDAYRTKVGNRNHFEVLDLERAADAAAVKAAYFRLAKRFHPDAYRGLGMEDLRYKLKAVFVRLSEAKEVLGNPRKRGDYESTLPRRRFNPPRAEPPGGSSPSGSPPQSVPGWAEPSQTEEETASRGDQALARAEAFMAEEKYWDAIQALETNLGDLAGPRLQKARLLLARAYAKNPKWRRRAEEAAQKVTKDDPGNADAYLILASVYRASGLESRASAMYRKVLELQPQNQEAREAVAVNDPPPPTSTPFLKRFFRKS